MFNNFEEHSTDPEILEMRELKLEELSTDESIRLFFNMCDREILEEELDPATAYLNSVKERVKQEPNFVQCKNLPGKIIQLAA